ncbi:hypothetical protein X943_002429 [Babesia divergens]|uniref:UBX domain-containing protein n=1 Tax=Babesia divergens TaxID=32595 RepID=A0AAD9LJ57_BABDI|nr:hypothetical protein X943_002429 [Babesia divergens]
MDCLKRHIYSTHRHLLRFYSKICTILSGILGYIIGFFATSRRMLTNLFGASSESFARQFESKYGPLHPKFFEGSIQAAQSAAFRDGKLLAVYIQSGQDHVSGAILTHKLVIEVLDTNCIFYAGYAKGCRMRRLIQNLGVTRFPHLSIMSMKSQTDYTLVARVEDFSSVSSVILQIVSAMDNPTVSVAPLRGEFDSSRSIIEEQNAEFQRAVEADRARMLAHQLEHSESIHHRRQKEELAQKRQALITERKAFAKEYSKTHPTGNTKIRVRLPSGATVESVFNKDDPVQKLYDWVGAAEYFSEKPVHIPYTFDLSMLHPSTTLDDRSQTLEDADLYPNASLVLISRDDSDEEDV